MPICAYCQTDAVLTREHVIPSFLCKFIDTNGPRGIGWNESAGRVIAGQAKIKDVCAACNNGALGALDEYGKSTLVSSGIMNDNYTSRKLTLNYDYDLLARWLLKISFNSARTDSIHASLFYPHIPFILNAAPRPHRANLTIFGYLAAPEIIDEEDLNKFSARGHTTLSRIFNPFIVRISYGYVSNQRDYTLRIVSFGALVFYLMLFNSGTPSGHASARARAFAKRFVGAKELTHTRKVLELHCGKNSFLELFEAQALRQLDVDLLEQ